MKPEVALAGKLFDGVEEITVLYREWLEAYESIANEYPSVKDQVKMLTERIKRAYELFVEQDRQKPSLIGDFCADDVFMRELDRQTKAECDALDGDFILGNEKDMRFAARGFSVREIALIQLGLAHTIDLEATAKHVPVDFIRKGFLLELEGRFGEAAKTYRPANFSALENYSTGYKNAAQKLKRSEKDVPYAAAPTSRIWTAVALSAKRAKTSHLIFAPKCGSVILVARRSE